MRFLYVFPPTLKSGYALAVEQLKYGELLVCNAQCLRDSAPDKAIARAVCRVRLRAGQYQVMSVEQLLAYMQTISGVTMPLSALRNELGLDDAAVD
jgi:hypothetical protein